MPEDTYPTPLHSASYDTGPLYLKFQKLRKDWAAVTLISKFEDQGIHTNISATDVLQEYLLEYDGLDERDAQILDDFWDAHGLHIPFTFIEPRDKPSSGSEGATVTGCRFISYEADHSQINIQKRTVRIGKYPA
jgi:hypothetical protein